MYPFKEIEKKWQEYWEVTGIHKTKNFPERKKFYVLEMFPYPSGDLHMGHLKNYVIGDVVSKIFRRMGFEVLHPMGWDAFGLPAENAAIEKGIHPKEWTERNISNYRQILKSLGISYDWNREISTCNPDYYKWTQWLFVLLYKNSLAYRAEATVNWCPKCKTTLANEQVVNGKCERCKTPVVKKELVQWFFKITSYAERLLEDLKRLQDKWPSHIIKLQENWIGKQVGTKIGFYSEDFDEVLWVFTTRADTLFGVTFLACAPEHPFIKKHLHKFPNSRKIIEFRERYFSKTEIERMKAEVKEGVFTGIYLKHPFLDKKVPLYVADYVLMEYGTGAVMGVPAHDQRDFEFAKKYNLEIKPVIKPLELTKLTPDELTHAFEEYGVLFDSGKFSGLDSTTGIQEIGKELEKMGLGGPSVSYKLRDWLVSRQRYWGAPIPIIYCEECGTVPVPEKDLPVLLPENVESYLPKGRSPLDDIEEFKKTLCPKCGRTAIRDTDTMDTFVDSSWYFFRFIDPKNNDVFCDFSLARIWMPVDQYIGGAEHATKHLIYSRFITKVLYDLGYSPVDEPFERLFTQGLVLKKFFFCPSCERVAKDEEVINGIHISCNNAVEEKLEMMSKSRGNIVAVGPFVEKYGADVARLAILFIGPADKDVEWSDAVVGGVSRFVNRVWSLVNTIKYFEPGTPDPKDEMEIELKKALHKTIKSWSEDVKDFHFNTALAKLMEFLNKLWDFPNKESPVFMQSLKSFVLMLSPFAPHLAEEIWQNIFGFKSSIHLEPMLECDEKWLIEDVIVIPVQVNGKLRGKITVRAGITEEEAYNQAIREPKIQKLLENKVVKKVVFIKDRLLNIVVEE